MIVFLLTTLLMAWFVSCIVERKRRIKIKQWRKRLDLDGHYSAFQSVVTPVDGFSLSKKARAKSDAIEYVYGEIEFTSFIALLTLAHPNKNTIFYDLGSGIGKAVIACAMVFDVHKSCGIELFPLLHQAALKLQECLQEIPRYSEKSKTMQFVNMNFLDANYKDATLIFINAVGFIGDTWASLTEQLAALNPGTTIITISKKLTSSVFTVIKTTRVQMSWGVVAAYIQIKTPPIPTHSKSTLSPPAN